MLPKMLPFTPHMIHRLFPHLAGTRWGYINLNRIAMQLQPLLAPLMSQPTNPFLDPGYCEMWKGFVHQLMGIDNSWGGYMEDRAVVWAGHYHDEGATMHVGVDFYVAAGCIVHMPVDATLVYSTVDPDQEGGWGGRMVFRYKDEHFILAHLRDMDMRVGKEFKRGEPVAVIAEDHCNGGWSPHLHWQRVRSLDLDHVLSVDGYVRPYEGIKEDFPNPLDYLD